MHVEIEAPSDESAGGPDLLLLHGGIGTGRYHWSKQIKGLTGAGFRLHMPDLPGHGQTPVGDQPYGRSVLVDAVREYASSLDHRPIVAGFSMGGHTAMGLAATDPELFAGLILIGVSIADHDGLGAWRSKFDPDVLEESFPLWARQLSKLHAPLGGPDAWRDVCIRDSTKLSAEVDTDALAVLDVPTLLVRGDGDETVDPGHFGRLREIWPHAEEFVVPGGGHDVQLTRSRVTGPVFVDFLGRHAEDGR
ncbi:alpha/beta fold hydrolase [Euzebya tangerina]|uniref:alpha/beta fold hydrolase n=1 Tax=Euzebya tangerina TaxID=591198 RepID=UPI0013C2C1F1|nr:alpha/beta fold hydrolase [Euzebya tangerina]